MQSVTRTRPLALRATLAVMGFVLLWTVLPGTAAAATFYAAAGGGITAGCPAAAPCTLNGPGSAIAQANAAPGRDTVQILGPLSFSTGLTLDLATSPIDLVGSGSGYGGTLIDATLVRALDVG